MTDQFYPTSHPVAPQTYQGPRPEDTIAPIYQGAFSPPQRGQKRANAYQNQQFSRSAPAKPAPREILLSREILTDDYYRDLHLKIELETRTYEATKFSGPEIPKGAIIQVLEITKSGFRPKGNQRPSEEMITQNTPDISVFWENYRSRSEEEDVLWRETLRYEGPQMEEVDLLNEAYKDIKTKRGLVDSVFSTLGVL